MESALFIPSSWYTEVDILQIMNTIEGISNLAAPPIMCTQTTYYKLTMIADSELKSSILWIPIGKLKAVGYHRSQLQKKRKKNFSYHGHLCISLKNMEQMFVLCKIVRKKSNQWKGIWKHSSHTLWILRLVPPVVMLNGLFFMPLGG